MYTPSLPNKNSVFDVNGSPGYCVPTEKRVRAYIGGSEIANSDETLILRRPKSVPQYAFPKNDVKISQLKISGEHEDSIGKYQLLDLKDVPGKEEIAILYRAPVSGAERLRDHVVFDWHKIDKWMEENEVISGHTRDPYTRIDVRESDRRIEVRVKGEKIAETARPRLLFETGLPVRYYIPAEDVKMNYLYPSELQTSCPYKGKASYWDIKVGGEELRNLVWSYVDPYDESLAIKGYFCFYNEKLDTFLVDGTNINSKQQV